MGFAFKERTFKTFENCKFIFTLMAIFIGEYLMHLLSFTDYFTFIHNVAIRLSRMNILFVKLFQAVALNNNIIDELANKVLIEFTDSVPYTEDDIDKPLLKNIQDKYNLEFDVETPINSGMISLVYKAKTADNSFSIVKIKRKFIDEKLSQAIDQVKFVNYVFSQMPFYKKLNIQTIVEKTLLSMMQQLNFFDEVKNTIEMNKNCVHLDYVKIPKVNEHATYLYPNAIIMEFIEGNHISNIDEADYEVYAKQVLKYGFVTAFMSGLTHGDMHPGNILFIKDENSVCKIAPIDFGLVVRLENERLKETMVDIASELFTSSSYECAEKMISVFLNPPDLKRRVHIYFYSDLVCVVSDILKETIHSKKSSDQVRIYEFFQRFNELIKNKEFTTCNVEVNEDFIKLQSAISMANGISVTLCKNNYIRVVNEVLDEIFHVNLFMEE